MSDARPAVFSHLLLAIGIVACASSVIFLKASNTHPYWLSGARLLIAAAALSPLYFIELRKTRAAATRVSLDAASRPSPRAILLAWPGGLVLAAHFISWTLGARMTDAANGSLIVNLTPAVMPFVMFAMNGERVNRGEIVGTFVSMIGVGLLIATHYSFSPQHVGGDLVCFGSMTLFCVYLALGRKQGMGRNLWLYVVPLYAMAGVTCWFVAVLTRTPWPVLNAKEIGLLLCLGLVPTVVGHSIMNWCIKHLRGQIVSTANLGQFIVAGLIAFFQIGEKPAVWFYPASALIVFGAGLVIRANRKTVDVDAES